MAPDGLPLSFNLFSSLPVELQREIWRISLSEPRIIQVHGHGRDGIFCFNGARPVALYACRTSREVACSFLKAAFTENNTSPNKPLPAKYINFAKDTIYLTTPYDFWTTPYKKLVEVFPNARKIQSLAIEVSSEGTIDLALDYVLFPLLEFVEDIEGYLGEWEIAAKCEEPFGKMGAIWKGALREIIVVVGHQPYPSHEAKHAEKFVFSEPKAMPWKPWQTWKDLEDHWTEQTFNGENRGVVRFKEVKMI